MDDELLYITNDNKRKYTHRLKLLDEKFGTASLNQPIKV